MVLLDHPVSSATFHCVKPSVFSRWISRMFSGVVAYARIPRSLRLTTALCGVWISGGPATTHTVLHITFM